MNHVPVASMIYAASSPEAGDARACWALARRTARYITDGEILPNEELAYSRLDRNTVGIARFLCASNGKLRDWAMISIDTNNVPRAVALPWTRLQTLLQSTRAICGGGLTQRQEPQNSDMQRRTACGVC